MWDEQNCQSFETAARGFEPGLSIESDVLTTRTTVPHYGNLRKPVSNQRPKFVTLVQFGCKQHGHILLASIGIGVYKYIFN